jgi:hypothetical protein
VRTLIVVGVLLLHAPPALAQARAAAEGEDLPLVPWAHPPPPPELPPEPSRGGGWLGAGILFLTFGTLTTVALGACHDNSGEWSGRCVGGVLGAGLGMVALGGSFLTVGIVQRSRYLRWKRRPPPPPPRIVLAPAGAGILLSGWF